VDGHPTPAAWFLGNFFTALGLFLHVNLDRLFLALTSFGFSSL